MYKFLKFSAAGLLMIFSVMLFDRAAAAQTVLAGGGIGGAWRLNAAESDDTLRKMRELIRTAATTKTAASPDAGASPLPPLTVSLFHPDSLILVDGDGQLTINEGFKEIVQTRTVFADGRTRAFELSEGASYTVRAVREGGRVTIETVSPRGNKMIENYELADGGRKLKIAVRIENADGWEMVTLRRIYDRTMSDLFPGDGEF